MGFGEPSKGFDKRRALDTEISADGRLGHATVQSSKNGVQFFAKLDRKSLRHVHEHQKGFTELTQHGKHRNDEHLGLVVHLGLDL